MEYTFKRGELDLNQVGFINKDAASPTNNMIH